MFAHECWNEMVLRYSPSDLQVNMLHVSFILDRHNSLLPAHLTILNFITLIAYSEKY